MAIASFFQELTDRPGWKVYSGGAQVAERLPRVFQYLTIGMAALLPGKAIRCPLLCGRLTCRNVVQWCGLCRDIGHTLICLGELCEWAGGKQFDKPDLFSNLSDASSILAAFATPLAIAHRLELLNLGQCALFFACASTWGEAGEPFFGLLAELCRRCEQDKDERSRSEKACLRSALGCEALFRYFEDCDSSLIPPLGLCSGVLSLYQGYKDS